ncbi:MAG: ABC-F family ATP-binding cassette domain-containing protein, partial [Chitinophagaceae bacterium]
ALGVDAKLEALKAILAGDVTEENLTLLDDDWTIEERCAEALQHWQLPGLDLSERLERLSGGQKTRVFLAGISIHQPQLVLLDEPTNHLDTVGRELLYETIRTVTDTVIVVSHDRKLLNQLHTICELDKHGITVYGGNYAFYEEQKQLQNEDLAHDVKAKEKALRKAKEKERETLERQQKLDARGRKKQEKAGVPTIMLNTLRNNAEKSTAKVSSAHSEKIDGLYQDLQSLRKSLPEWDKMRLGFDPSGLHKGKVLFKAKDINFSYSSCPLWQSNFDLEINSGERIAILGANGSGKTTLIRMILGELEPQTGELHRADFKAVYIDQDYSLIHNNLQVYEQAQRFNSAALQEHEIKTRLDRFLFGK